MGSTYGGDIGHGGEPADRDGSERRMEMGGGHKARRHQSRHNGSDVINGFSPNGLIRSTDDGAVHVCGP